MEARNPRTQDKMIEYKRLVLYPVPRLDTQFHSIYISRTSMLCICMRAGGIPANNLMQGSKRMQRIRGRQGYRERSPRVGVIDHIQSCQVKRYTGEQEEAIQKVLGSNTS
ncbi:hypothetical protein H112_08190 [Trichophyton rubrum D6]|uniref:Uncharacterized protein n=3 Tax=Trichophyton TaxID=5550 RepID=A0A080WID1_TRIRC|nr:uncharacterized protein TERG_11623 [Trichophyton rubrum CBS 118892]EZF10559.1 hypothetical protein H100_08218 [Trichophyton rubrum MR850]EZF37404.1 hypothetical protein H102_08175 [Trichophyton rubrum CBS 100081]EZF48101.1 hypothetical protein H103_08200 [Trichophyton rubrum CBS 288.86]EZF58699.1 hypothetical protein H104_08151 [Trichophyton rubrum CBS 289.86]EZF69359.1 hypothetical protein H105_08202 [Trichophyton soudanense CBS 452.61]EZF80001.1 hypothetical protein H110_08197 [Trichophy